MNLSRSLHLCFLMLLGTAALAPSMHGMQYARAFVAQAARAVKNHGAKFKPQTRLTLAAGTVAATSAALLYAQKPFQFCTMAHAQGALKPTVQTSLQQSEEIPAEEQARITKIIDEHIHEVLEKMRFERTTEFDWLRGYMFKKDTERVEGAKIFFETIKEHNLKLVTVPEQFIYTIPPKHSALARQILGEKEEQRFVVAKKLEGTLGNPINLEQAQDIATLFKHARYKERYYCDAHSGNLIHQANGQIGFIDTELMSFCCPSYKIALGIFFMGNQRKHDASLFLEIEYEKAKNEIDKQKSS